jgi:mRNA interferase MazF
VVARGELWWYEHPDSGRRPVAILTRDEAIPVLEQLLAVPATRTVRSIPTEVRLDRDDGVPEPCVLTLDNVTLVRKSLLVERIALLAPERMEQVCEALGRATSCH